MVERFVLFTFSSKRPAQFKAVHSCPYRLSCCGSVFPPQLHMVLLANHIQLLGCWVVPKCFVLYYCFYETNDDLEWELVSHGECTHVFSGNQQRVRNSLVLLENGSKMKLLSDFDFFQDCSCHRTVFSAKYYTNSWCLSGDTAGRRSLAAYFQPAWGSCLFGMFFFSFGQNRARTT